MGLVESGCRGIGSALLAGALACGLTGCVREYVMIQTGIFPEPMIFEDALEWTRQGAAAINTMHDFEAARGAAFGNMGTLEGMHKLVPDDENGLFLLTRAWASISYAFMDDEREAALDRNDEALASYHEARARAGFQRARFYGELLLDKKAEGFRAATRNAETLRAFLRAEVTDAEDAETLLWLGFSTVGRVAFDMDNPEAVADLWIGVELLEHVVRLDDRVENGSAHTMLGAYYARSAQSELDEARRHFDRAMQIHSGRLLTTQVTLAQRYHCMRRDKKSYDATLAAVLEAGDIFPEQRISNVIAKRRARRYVDNKFWQQDCAFEG